MYTDKSLRKQPYLILTTIGFVKEILGLLLCSNATNMCYMGTCPPVLDKFWTDTPYGTGTYWYS